MCFVLVVCVLCSLSAVLALGHVCFVRSLQYIPLSTTLTVFHFDDWCKSWKARPPQLKHSRALRGVTGGMWLSFARLKHRLPPVRVTVTKRHFGVHSSRHRAHTLLPRRSRKAAMATRDGHTRWPLECTAAREDWRAAGVGLAHTMATSRSLRRATGRGGLFTGRFLHADSVAFTPPLTFTGTHHLSVHTM